MMSFITKIFFRIHSWEIHSQLPSHIKKSVIVGAPHTTNYDLPYSLLLAFLFKLRIHWMGKMSIFSFPWKFLLLYLGGIPIDRSVSDNRVTFYAETIKSSAKEFHLVIAPAGTRKNIPVKEWSTGFYYIALMAGVPIVLAYVDYKNRKGGIGTIFYPTGNYADDIKSIETFYAQWLPVE